MPISMRQPNPDPMGSLGQPCRVCGVPLGPEDSMVRCYRCKYWVHPDCIGDGSMCQICSPPQSQDPDLSRFPVRGAIPGPQGVSEVPLPPSDPARIATESIPVLR